MLRIQKILFPVDFSERCTSAASQVAAMVRHFNAKLKVLHVVEAGPLWYGEMAAAELQALADPEEIRKERQLTLDSYLQENFQRLSNVEEILEKGEPVHVITEYARKEGIDLIMMPAHGYGPFRRFLLGSRPEETRFRAYLIESAREYIAGLQRLAGTEARVCIECGKISEVLRNAAFHHAADMIVIGQGCMHETLGRLRSNAYTIVRESPCPVVRV